MKRAPSRDQRTKNFRVNNLDSEESLVSTFVGCCSADGYGFAPSWIKNEGQGTRDKAYKAMSDYVETYGYKPESFAAIKYAFTGENLYDS